MRDQELALALREHLRELQLPQIAHGRRAIILFEGPEGAGKKAALRQLAAAFDPCHFAVHAIQFDRRQAAEGHWLARFWRAAAGGRRHRDLLPQLVPPGARRPDPRPHRRQGAARSFDEINEFEAQQRDYGTLIVKLFFDVTAEVQARGLPSAAADPWLRSSRANRRSACATPTIARRFDDLQQHSDTRWSPWRMIDGDDERRRVAALSAIADAWAEAMPAEPPHLVDVAGARRLDARVADRASLRSSSRPRAGGRCARRRRARRPARGRAARSSRSGRRRHRFRRRRRS